MPSHAIVRRRGSAPARHPGPPAAQSPEVRHIVHAPRPQAKLTVGAPNDAFEKEAAFFEPRFGRDVVQQGSPDRIQRQAASNAQLREQLCFGVTGPGPTRCEFTPSQNRKVVFSLFAARSVAGRALQNLGGHDPHVQRLAARIFNVPTPDMNALIGTTQQIITALALPVRCGTCHDPTCNSAAPGGAGGSTQAAAYVPDDLGSIVICPFFFSLGVMQMRRTILHEAGHAAGIDSRPDYEHPRNCPEGSSDCMDPCTGITDRLHNVDVWARFLECAAAAR